MILCFWSYGARRLSLHVEKKTICTHVHPRWNMAFLGREWNLSYCIELHVSKNGVIFQKETSQMHDYNTVTQKTTQDQDNE